MEQQLQNALQRVVGTKQVLRAVNDGKAARVFLGKDADGFIYHRVQALCEEKQVPVTVVDSMQELGKLCAVSVKTAAAAALK
ncbi:MAG: ribosomal L7Ae/L30e/S12e/Gadd45 family protein [Eubacteriales bacterium]|nr:ribosomal L7Ae/L30e/S12e/Gadd45 family protein [Eubacteriales bacterium]